MKIKTIPYLFSICKLNEILPDQLSNQFSFLSVTDNEISLVCKTENVPENAIYHEDGWRCYRIEGSLDFSLIGIIADISTILAQNNIPVFTVSTYDTDYFFIKTKFSLKAMNALKNKGYEI